MEERNSCFLLFSKSRQNFDLTKYCFNGMHLLSLSEVLSPLPCHLRSQSDQIPSISKARIRHHTLADFLITWPFDRTSSSWMAQFDVSSHYYDPERSLTPAISSDHTWVGAIMYCTPLLSCLNQSLKRHTVQSELMTCAGQINFCSFSRAFAALEHYLLFFSFPLRLCFLHFLSPSPSLFSVLLLHISSFVITVSTECLLTSNLFMTVAIAGGKIRQDSYFFFFNWCLNSVEIYHLPRSNVQFTNTYSPIALQFCKRWITDGYKKINLKVYGKKMFEIKWQLTYSYRLHNGNQNPFMEFFL